MKKVTAVLVVYAIIVIASSIFWVWCALSKPRLTAGSANVNINPAAVPGKMNQDAEMVTDKATELTGGVKEDVKGDGQASNIVKSNDL
jgi:hypothetical protein